MAAEPSALTLTDAGMETVLLFEDGIDLPCFASFPLLDTEEGRTALRRYYEPFLQLARARSTAFVLSSPTWRANPDWGDLLGYDREALSALNRRSIEFLADLRDDVLSPEETAGVVTDGCVGPRSDAYRPALRMDAEEAASYHGLQLLAFADAGCAQATALTLSYPEEAIGIVLAAQRVGLPIVIGFTVETDGRLPNVDSIAEAVRQVDEATDGAARSFMIK